MIKASLVLVGVVCVVAEIIGPKLGEQAWRARALAIAGDIILRKESGTNYWFRDGQRFIGIRDMVYGQIPTGVEIYEFGDAARLDQYTYAREAQRDGDGSWRLIDVVRKRFDGMKIHVEPLDSLSWQGFLSPKHVALIEREA